jgi:hypothetical protein
MPWIGKTSWPGYSPMANVIDLETCQRAGRSGLEFVSQTLRAFGNLLLARPVLLAPR